MKVIIDPGARETCIAAYSDWLNNIHICEIRSADPDAVIILDIDSEGIAEVTVIDPS